MEKIYEQLGAPFVRFVESEQEAFDVFCGDYFADDEDENGDDHYVFESMKSENLILFGREVIKYTSNNGHILYQVISKKKKRKPKAVIPVVEDNELNNSGEIF
jgi:hypothetical protein